MSGKACSPALPYDAILTNRKQTEDRAKNEQLQEKIEDSDKFSFSELSLNLPLQTTAKIHPNSTLFFGLQFLINFAHFNYLKTRQLTQNLQRMTMRFDFEDLLRPKNIGLFVSRAIFLTRITRFSQL